MTIGRAAKAMAGLRAVARRDPFPVRRWFFLPAALDANPREAMPVQFTGPSTPFLSMPR